MENSEIFFFGDTANTVFTLSFLQSYLHKS